MQETISTIIKQNSQLFGDNPQIKKINVGFTNTIFVVNDLYIIKICTNEDNENNFKSEINFYKENIGNNLFPKLYVSDISKKDVPYCYEIIEKIDGVSLYNVWHTFSEDERENIIKQLCDAMKSIHSNKSKEQNFDWNNYLQNQFTELYSKAKTLNIFTEQEQKLIEYAFSTFSKYLQKEELVLIHNDLHFDNIFYKDGKIKIIDFERSMYAPKDFELDILYRMIRKPWKFASEETEQYTNSSDYTNIKLYIEKYYPELVNVEFLPQRLAIYDMIYYLRQLINYQNSKELKNDVISAAKIVSLKDELNFENIENDAQLMDFMNINIEYGWVDKYGLKHLNNLKGFRENYKTMSIEEILETGLGTCIEQAKLIKYFFDKIGLENKLYCHRGYETEENFDKEVRMHCFVLFNYNDNWYHFEHSNIPKRGIHKYGSINDAIKKITSGFEEHNDIRVLTEIPNIPTGLSFKEFNQYVNQFDAVYLKEHNNKIK